MFAMVPLHLLLLTWGTLLAFPIFCLHLMFLHNMSHFLYFPVYLLLLFCH